MFPTSRSLSGNLDNKYTFQIMGSFKFELSHNCGKYRSASTSNVSKSEDVLVFVQLLDKLSRALALHYATSRNFKQFVDKTNYDTYHNISQRCLVLHQLHLQINKQKCSILQYQLLFFFFFTVVPLLNCMLFFNVNSES